MKITYIADWVSKDGGLLQWLEPEGHCRMCTAAPTLYRGACLPQSWWAITGGSSKDLHVLHSPLVSILLGKGAQQEVRVSIAYQGCYGGFWIIEMGVHDSNQSWCSVTTPNHSCWWLNAPKDTWQLSLGSGCCHKDRLGAVLSQKQENGWYHPVVYGSRALTSHKKNYHSNKLEFLALKWAGTEHFKEYLLY